MPGCGPRITLASVRLRCSIGVRRRSSPSSSNRSKAHSTAWAPWRARRISSNTASPSSSVTMASPSRMSHRQRRYGRHGQWEAFGEIVAVAGDQPHAGSVPQRQDAEAVMLDFVEPIRAARRGFGRRWQAGLNKTHRDAAITQCPACKFCPRESIWRCQAFRLRLLHLGKSSSSA